MLNAIENGYQAALMAPTEILAEQHYGRYSKLLDNLDVNIALLKGSLPEKEKKLILEQIESGKISAVFGTHALIQKDVRFKQLSVVIVDEQHRFGVEQRAAFKSKGSEPDMLAMTATPIPRTMALTFYGDLDLSIIDEKPAGRKDVLTAVYSKDEMAKVQDEVLRTINKNRQVYIVCPLIEESEKLDLASLEEEVRRWTDSVLKDCSVGVIHGKLNSINKNEIMERFARGDIKVLFCTTVIEVGMDIQNACMIVILNAERYGLSQLHQMRGRVGRGSAESKCVLVADASQEKTEERLEAFVNNFDGFILAEIDLTLRKEGRIFGQKQWGRSDLKLASLPKDIELLKQARDEAFKLVKTSPKLKKYPHLAKEIDRLYSGSISWINKS
jgi:ATP-dependent DNA helicase RecG